MATITNNTIIPNCNCVCQLCNCHANVVDLHQQLSVGIASNKSLHDEIDKLILICNDLKEENEKLIEHQVLQNHDDGNFTPSSKQSLRTKYKQIAEKKQNTKIEKIEDDGSEIAPLQPLQPLEPEDFRKKGRKQGHPGATKKLEPTVHVHDFQLTCTLCGSKLSKDQQKTGGYQTVEIPRMIPLTVTQHYTYQVNCDNCDQISANHSNLKGTIFGPNAVAFLTNLWYTGVVTLAKLGEIFDYLTGELFSDKTINKALLVAAETVRPEVAKIKEELVASKHPHLDETSYVYVDKTRELCWIFVIATQKSVVFEFRHDRKAKFLQDSYWNEEILDEVVPILDGWQSYNFFKEKQRCWAHVLIEARNVATVSDPAKLVHQELRELFFDLQQSRGLQLKSYEGIRKRADGQLGKIIDRLKDSKHKKLKAFHTKLRKARPDLLTALNYPDLALENNHAERLLRHLVLMRKTRGKVASTKGAEALMLLASFFETCKLRKINPRIRLIELLEGMIGKN